MKLHTRKCANETCVNILENTRTRSLICAACERKARNEGVIAADRALLEGMYINVDGPSEPNKNNKREWTFTHAECGTRQTWVIGNVKNRLKSNPNYTPCSYCGKLR